MATLYISEFSRVMLDARGLEVMAPDLDSLTAEQTVTIGVGSTQSNPLNSATRFVLLANDAIYSLAYGSNPTAVITAHRIAANEVRFYGATGGNKIAAIANT
jgi:hypothetical protein